MVGRAAADADRLRVYRCNGVETWVWLVYMTAIEFIVNGTGAYRSVIIEYHIL